MRGCILGLIVISGLVCSKAAEGELYAELKAQKTLSDFLDSQVTKEERSIFEIFFRAKTDLRTAFDDVYYSADKSVDVNWVYSIGDSVEMRKGGYLVLILGDIERKLAGRNGALKVRTDLKEGLNDIHARLHMKDGTGETADLGIRSNYPIFFGSKSYFNGIREEFRQSERAGNLAKYMTPDRKYAPSEREVLLERCLAIHRKEKDYRTNRRSWCLCVMDRAVEKGFLKKGEVYQIDEATFALKGLTSAVACSWK